MISSAPAARILATLACAMLAAGSVPAQQSDRAFTLEQLMSYPYPAQLTAAGAAARIAWTFNERGARNVYVAEGPGWRARKVTTFDADEGQGLTSLALSADGRWLVWVRGGAHGSNWEVSAPVNATADPGGARVQIWGSAFDGEPRVLAEGDFPALSPRGDLVAFVRDRQVWVVPIDGSGQPKRMFVARGDAGELQWSPDGSRLAFVSGRGSHSMIGVYTNDTTPVRWIAPSTSRDLSPRWSPDGTKLVFVRRPGGGGEPQPVLEQRHSPWEIWTADARTGAARRLWTAPQTLRGSVPTTHGGTNLHWAAGRIVFLSYADGWPHLYSIPDGGGEPLQLTRGNFMVEHVRLSPDRRFLLFSANTGPAADDIDRRHVARVSVDRADAWVLTPGTGLEWMPVVADGGDMVAFISATTRRPPLPAVMAASGGTPRLLAEDRIPADFPTAHLVPPRQVVYRAPDGTAVHAQLFERPGGSARKPAVIYVHGGPPRQMLLGWHYSDYYSNAYAVNQYLSSRGLAVLSVNFRLGIGYGHDFHHPPDGGARGASEYQDVTAGAEWLRAQPNIDGSRIGIYGGSYGGYLTALALARDSDLFAAGVDIHGVHDWTAERMRFLVEPRYERIPDAEAALEIAWRASPVSSIDRWRSPVLIIHADDDRNVRFTQSVDLVQRLRAAGVEHEELVIPDDTHHFLVWRNQLLVNRATAEFLERTLGGAARAGREPGLTCP